MFDILVEEQGAEQEEEPTDQLSLATNDTFSTHN